MAKFYDKLTDELESFIQEQKIFFTATAPQKGRINLSPKGIDTLRCIDKKTVAYLDLTGSGNETAAHIQENGRMTIMFCSFTDKPLILRLYGQGQVILPRDPTSSNISLLFPSLAGQRQIIILNIESIQTSCGMAVPLYEFKQERQALINWATQKGQEGLEDYWQRKNQKSIDGLPTNLLEN